MQDHIRALIEKRTFEAAKKEISKKMQIIARYLGRPVIEQISTARDLPNFWELEDNPDDFRIVEADENMREVLRGYYFDGLKYGVNLTIHTLTYEDKVKEIKAHYQGYLVFQESEGELQGYAPFTSWENHLNSFYEAALPVEQKQIIHEKEVKKESNKKKMQALMKRLKLIWGI